MMDATHQDWTPGDPIGYIRPEIPAFRVPAYAGRRYVTMAPDTLDLQDRAALGINVLTRSTDPLADYEIYFWMRVMSNPPVLIHDYSDICEMKFMEALPLLRIITGSDANAQVDRRWMEVALHQQGPDGLAYWPKKGRPWTLEGTFDTYVRAGAADADAQLLVPVYCGRLLRALTLYAQRDGGPFWKGVAERMVDGLADLAIDAGRYAYFSPQPTWARKGSTEDAGRQFPGLGGHAGFVVSGLTKVYQTTGYEPARRLAHKLIRYLLDESSYFDGEARFLPDQLPAPGRPTRAHFHCHTLNLQAFLEFGLAIGDAGLVEFARQGFEYGRARGNAVLGYFPEGLDTPEFEHSELCEVADMIALALKLSAGGVGDYWDDADRWARNMFAEGQLTRTDWIARLHHLATDKWDEADRPRSAVAYNETSDRAVERSLGAFAGYPTANDWWPGAGMGTMHCCTGNGTRAIYYLWDHILTHDAGRLRVNLLLNRASPWADIDSHIPYVGQVDVKVKQPLDLALRIPEWVQPGETRCQVNGQDRTVTFRGRYAEVGAVTPGDGVTLTFPIAERMEAIWVEKDKYVVIRKGNEVVSIDPAGRYCPLYLREHYRQNSTRWRQVERFVSDEIVHW